LKKNGENMMKTYESMNKEELLRLKSKLEAEYNAYKRKGLRLDMSRGKPCEEQLDISSGLLDFKQRFIHEG